MNSDELSFNTLDVEEADLDALLGGLPASTASADTLKHVKVEGDQEPLIIGDDNGPDLDELLAIGETVEEETDEDEKPVEEKPKVEAEKKETKKSKPKAEELDGSALKQITDFYIESGYWKDFEGREDLEYTTETFQELLVEQNKEIAKEQFDKLLESAGTVGKTIIEHITKGGKADEIIDLFKEQKENAEFTTDSIEGKKAYIAQYYKDVHGFSNEKIKRIVTAAEADDILDEEISEIKTSYEKYYSKELQRIEEEREANVNKQKELEEKFQSDITNELTSRKDLSDRDKKLIKEAVLNYDHVLSDGSKVNKLYIKFAELQDNPKEYLDFVQFVMDKEKFVERIRKQEENKAAEKVFFKIKRNQSVNGKTGSGHMSVSADKEIQEFKWN